MHDDVKNILIFIRKRQKELEGEIVVEHSANNTIKEYCGKSALTELNILELHIYKLECDKA